MPESTRPTTAPVLPAISQPTKQIPTVIGRIISAPAPITSIKSSPKREVLTLRGLVTYYVLFFIHLESRRVDIAGLTVHPNELWMKQIARNVSGALRDCRYLLHDRDTKFTRSFRAIIVSGRVEPLALPARSPNLNAYAERWVRSVKQECLSKVILFGERSLRRALSNYVDHFHTERNHQGKRNVLLFPRVTDRQREGPVRCRERLGGLLRYYHREAARAPSVGSVF
jgi:putative transposase